MDNVKWWHLSSWRILTLIKVLSSRTMMHESPLLTRVACMLQLLQYIIDMIIWYDDMMWFNDWYDMIDMIWWLITVFTLQWNKYHIIYSLYFDVFFTVCIEVFWRSFPAIVCLLGSRSRSMRTTMPWHTKMSLRAKWEGQETGNVCCQGLFADLRYWTAVKSASIVICF